MSKNEYLGEDPLLREYIDRIDYSLVKGSLFFETYHRILDIILSLLGLIIGLPIVLIVGIFIKKEDGGPITYSQKRMGKNGRIFYIYKLRSMRMDAERHGAQWAQNNDPRVTKIGSFIRKTRIDEIPQLWNILKGDMRIIGPRPERPVFTKEFEEKYPGFVNRLAIKPGLTGWAQVNGGYDMGPKEKLKYDLYYIQNRSLRLDLQIVFRTVIVVLSGDGAR